MTTSEKLASVSGDLTERARALLVEGNDWAPHFVVLKNDEVIAELIPPSIEEDDKAHKELFAIVSGWIGLAEADAVVWAFDSVANEYDSKLRPKEDPNAREGLLVGCSQHESHSIVVLPYRRDDTGTIRFEDQELIPDEVVDGGLVTTALGRGLTPGIVVESAKSFEGEITLPLVSITMIKQGWSVATIGRIASKIVGALDDLVEKAKAERTTHNATNVPKPSDVESLKNLFKTFRDKRW